MTPAALRSARQQLGLTQAGLAVVLGVTSTSVARWERGERPVPPWLSLALDGFRWRVRFQMRSAR